MTQSPYLFGFEFYAVAITMPFRISRSAFSERMNRNFLVPR